MLKPFQTWSLSIEKKSKIWKRSWIAISITRSSIEVYIYFYYYYVNRYILKYLYLVHSQTMLGPVFFFLVLDMSLSSLIVLLGCRLQQYLYLGFILWNPLFPQA